MKSKQTSPLPENGRITYTQGYVAENESPTLNIPHGYDGYNEPSRVWYHIEHIYKLKKGLYTPPVMVEVSPTSICNHRCVFCYTYQREETNMLSKKVLLDIFSNASDMGIETIFIQGTGEPMVNKYLPDAIVAGGKTDIKMSLTTHGVLLDKQKQEKILENLVFVKFSVVDNDPKKYALTHGCKEEEYHKLIDNIENATNFCSKNNLDTTLWATVYVDTDNFKNLYKICKFYKSLGLDFLSISQAIITEFMPSEVKLATEVYSEEEIDEMMEKVVSLQDDKFKLHIQFPREKQFPTTTRWKKDYCKAVHLVTSISGDGGVYSCWRFWGNKEHSYGNVYNKSFEEIWRGEKRKEVNKYLFSTPPKGDECSVCHLVFANHNLDKLLNNQNKWTYIL